MSVKGPVFEDGTRIKNYPNLIWFFRVINVKVGQVPDFLDTGVQFFWRDGAAMVLVKDLLYELSAMS